MCIDRRRLIGLVLSLNGLVAVSLMAAWGCGKSDFDSHAMKEHAEQLKKTRSFQFPLDEFFPEIPVTVSDPPQGERFHTGEDSFAPAGTPVYAIGNGTISYSAKARGYGWLIIIDHPTENVYSLYGHLSRSRWKKTPGEVNKGELIGYLAEAEEGETMVSHLHFGMRIGQQADYPRRGDWRWMAGYTKRRPDLRGWFQPSEIIGETDSMRAWKRSIQKRDNPVIGRSLHANDFKITSGKHSEKEDLDQIVKTEFGDQYRLADWNEILTFSMNTEDWADGLGLAEGEENSLLVSNDGYRIWQGRQYYISRFNHSKPDGYLAHDAIGDNLVCLGSWSDLNMHVLAVRK